MIKNGSEITVTQLNKQIRSWLETEVGEIAVIGELSNLTKPSSGHFYFTLKDKTAQVRCVYFRNYHDGFSKNFKDGQQVIARGKLSLYEARGDYQLIIQHLTEAGLGELYRQFELLKIKLQAQGLFDSTKKKPIPSFPTIIAVITSSSGAALHDILTTLERRYPLAKVVVYSSEVQGKDAAQQLIKALHKANKTAEADLILLARGGGSIEDLWAFNDEQLAWAIFNSALPIISGIGHETDFTIADFVVDLRTATPTAAAEAATPNQLDLIATLKYLEKRLIALINRLFHHKQLLFLHAQSKISSPHQLVAKHWQALDYFEQGLGQYIKNTHTKKKYLLTLLTTSLEAKNPVILIKKQKLKLSYLEQQLSSYFMIIFYNAQQALAKQSQTLHAVSPLATLDRGYAIATFNNKIIFDNTKIAVGAQIELQLAVGKLLCKIIEKRS